MTIQIDLDQLDKHKISPNDYVRAYLTAYDVNRTIPQDRDSPITMSDFRKVFLKSGDDAFAEIWSMYPDFTPDKRPLKTAINKCKQRYLKIINNNSGMHDKMVVALKRYLEVETSKRANYLVKFENYLKDEHYKLYLDKEVEVEQYISNRIVE